MRVLLSGYYGFGNLGDEALLDIIVGQIRTRFPAVDIEVLSGDPDGTRKRLPVDTVARWNPRDVRAAIARADVVISGGGGLLQNTTSLKSLLYYVGILHQAAKAKRKTMIFAQSIGPLDLFGRFVVREGCKHVTRATVRDLRSKELLESVLPSTPVEQTADPVFLYDTPDDDARLVEDGLGPESRPYALISVRKVTGFKDGVATLARAVDRLAEEHGIRSAFLPMAGVPDAETSTVVIRACKSAPVLLPECSLSRAAAIIRSAHVVVGMRLHALIFAARFGVPFAPVPYDPKVQSLCDDLAYPLGPLWIPGKPAPDSASADALIDRLVTQRESLAAHLTEKVEGIRVSAARNFEVLGELLGGA